MTSNLLRKIAGVKVLPYIICYFLQFILYRLHVYHSLGCTLTALKSDRKVFNDRNGALDVH